ncbi:MAG: hypothetical protein RLY31_2974 [Bacteroidota bacterium]
MVIGVAGDGTSPRLSSPLLRLVDGRWSSLCRVVPVLTRMGIVYHNIS